MENKLFIVLYGNRNQGKTTTLMDLVVLLGGGSAALEKALKSALLGKKRYKDARFVIKYNDFIIHIATGGDSWAVCRGNTQFFEGNNNGNQDVYLVSNGSISLMDIPEKKIFKDIHPQVVISACRPNADSYGAIKAIHSYSETHLSDYTEQVWIKRDIAKDPDSKKIAKEIKNIIDNFLK